MNTWHSDKMEAMKHKSEDELRYIAQDCREAAEAAKSLGNYEAEGRYLDEMHYAHMELAARRKKAAAKEQRSVKK